MYVRYANRQCTVRAAVFNNSYGLGNIGPGLFMVIGALQLMLAACYTLYALRDVDARWALDWTPSAESLTYRSRENSGASQ